MTCLRAPLSQPIPWLALAGALGCALPAAAKVGPADIGSMGYHCDRVVIARVVSVTPDLQSDDWALVDVLETWKGPPAARLEFLASPTWTCDISTAVVGETALLFLYDTRTPGRCVLSSSGRGRLPLTSDGEWVVASEYDINAGAIETRRITGEQGARMMWLAMDDLRRAVDESAAAQRARRARDRGIALGIVGLVGALTVRHRLRGRRPVAG